MGLRVANAPIAIIENMRLHKLINSPFCPLGTLFPSFAITVDERYRFENIDFQMM